MVFVVLAGGWRFALRLRARAYYGKSNMCMHTLARTRTHTHNITHTQTHTHTHTHTNTHTHEHTHILRLPAHLQGAQGTDSGDEGMLPFRGKHTMSMLANLHTRMLGGETVEA